MRFLVLACAVLGAVGCRIHYDPTADAGSDATAGAPDALDPSIDAALDASGDAGVPPTCGNGRIDPTEECDDGDADDGDACLATCRLARCGDGAIRAGVEACDDGNSIDADGCTAACVRCPGSADVTFVSPTNHHCYSWHDVSETWPSIRTQCHGIAAGGFSLGYGAHPATFATPAEHDEVFAGVGLTRSAWLGLHSFSPRTTFVWDDGPVTFSRWGTDEPSMSTNVPAILRADGTWAVAATSSRHGRLCEHESGWLVRPGDGHAYAYFGEPGTSRDLARARCATFGGHLLVLETAEEQLFVTAIAQPFQTWLGLSDESVEGTFAWENGAPLSYTFWTDGEPDGGSVEDCVVADDTLGRWFDRDCGDEYDFICELE